MTEPSEHSPAETLGAEFAMSPSGLDYLYGVLGDKPKAVLVDLSNAGRLLHQDAAASICRPLLHQTMDDDGGLNLSPAAQFYLGEALGLILAERFLPERLYEPFGSVLVDLGRMPRWTHADKTPDMFLARVRSELLELASFGWTEFAQATFSDYVSELESVLTPFGASTDLLSKGLGIVALAIDAAWSVDVHRQVLELTENSDFEAGLSQLLGPSD